MRDEIDLLDDSDFGADVIEFTRQAALDTYRASFGPRADLSARWDRTRTDIRFEDVVEELHGTTEQTISCPFHGRDSRPSFHLYRRTNDAYCYGCPEGQKLYDSVRFVSSILGITKVQAIAWLEKNYDLPPLEGIDEDDDADDEGLITRTLTFANLADPFIELASRAFLANPDPDLAREYIEIFFDATPERDSDPTSAENQMKLLPLARCLGPNEIERIKQRSFAR